MILKEKDNNKISKDSNKTDVTDSQTYSYVFSEGSRAVLNSHDFLENKEKVKIGSYSWIQINTGNTIISDYDQESNDQFFSFITPYVKDNLASIKLRYQLTVTYKDGSSSPPRKFLNNILGFC